MSTSVAMFSAFQARLRALVESALFNNAIIFLIIFNAITLGMETSDWVMARFGGILLRLDALILAVFVAELVARLIADFRGFWRDPWRIFDFIVVTVALVPSTGPLSVLRAFRILRVLRLVSSVGQMRRVVSGLLEALPGMATIILLLLMIFYIFAVICTKLYGETFPEWFGTLGESGYTLFQVMTLESWSMGIVRPVMEQHPFSWMLFVPFIIATAFTVLNLFIGVIVDAMQSEHESSARDERDAMALMNAEILAEVKALRREVADIRAKQP
ncbi:MAG: ion transporter [Pikeienuella sp.]